MEEFLLRIAHVLVPRHVFPGQLAHQELDAGVDQRDEVVHGHLLQPVVYPTRNIAQRPAEPGLPPGLSQGPVIIAIPSNESKVDEQKHVPAGRRDAETLNGIGGEDGQAYHVGRLDVSMEIAGKVDVAQGGDSLHQDAADGASREPPGGGHLLQVAHVDAQQLHDYEVDLLVVSGGQDYRNMWLALQLEQNLLLEDHPLRSPSSPYPVLRLYGHVQGFLRV